MNMHKKIAVASPLNESEVQDILGSGRHLNEATAVKRLESANKDRLADRQERAMSESLEDRQALVEAITAVASSTFLTEAQLAHLVDRHEDLSFAELTESKLLQLAMAELSEAAGEALGGQIQEARRLASEERRSIRLAERFESLNEARQPRREEASLGNYRNSLLESHRALNETALGDDSQVGDDINTIVFGKGDEIKLPVGYTHITVDLDGSVNAYTSKPVYGKNGWVGDSPKRIGRVVWDDHLVAGGSKDPRIIQSTKQEVTAKQVYNIQNGLSLTRPFTDAYAFKSWKALADAEDLVPQAAQVADPKAAAVSHTINESKKPVPTVNRFTAIPSHMV